MNEQTILNASHVIDALGGTLAVAAERGLGPSAVSMWRHNGIPGKHRLPLLRLAETRGLTIPDAAFDAPSPGAPSPSPSPSVAPGGDSGAGGALPDVEGAAAPGTGSAAA